jgi:hypothetical protein
MQARSDFARGLSDSVQLLCQTQIYERLALRAFGLDVMDAREGREVHEILTEHWFDDRDVESWAMRREEPAGMVSRGQNP